MDDHVAMREAITAAASARLWTAPNPWVGAVVVHPLHGVVGVGATEPPPGRHAEVIALGRAGARARGASLYVTLEPCSHHGRTPPCVDAVMAADVSRVVIGVVDPDPRVAGRGIAALRSSGIDVEPGCLEAEVTEQLEPYLHHRRTGRPYVVLKLAATVDGRTAAPDGTSQWITSEEARTDAHRLRAESGAVVVGAGTVRADDPSLTVRLVDGPDPLRVVLGAASPGAGVHPCLEWHGTIEDLLDHLGNRGVLQVLVEGGATVAASFAAADLVDRTVVYLAPALFGGDDALGMFRGSGVPTISRLPRHRFASVRRVGPDLRLDLVPANDRRPGPTGSSAHPISPERI